MLHGRVCPGKQEIALHYSLEGQCFYGSGVTVFGCPKSSILCCFKDDTDNDVLFSFLTPWEKPELWIEFYNKDVQQYFVFS